MTVVDARQEYFRKCCSAGGFLLVYREWSKKEEISGDLWFSGLKCLVDARGQRRIPRLL